MTKAEYKIYCDEYLEEDLLKSIFKDKCEYCQSTENLETETLQDNFRKKVIYLTLCESCWGKREKRSW